MAKAAKMTVSTQEVQRQLDKQLRHAAAYKAGPQVMLGLTNRIANLPKPNNRGTHPNSILAYRRNQQKGRCRFTAGSVIQLADELMGIIERSGRMTRENKALYAKLQIVRSDAMAMRRQLTEIVDSFYILNHQIPKE